MVANIEYPDMLKAFYYNENKVTSGKAVLHVAHLYPKEPAALSRREKLQRLKQLAELNTGVTKNTIHIFLSFEPTEKLEKATLSAIAQEYMELIGYGQQPYLVYEHCDTAIQHVHILTTCVQKNGKRIPTHNNANLQSEPARKHLEIKYGLIRAEGRNKGKPYVLKPADLQAAIYGESETKAEISKIVRSVVAHYTFTSLIELNVILKHFNVIGYRGDEGSRMFQMRGVMYSLMEPNGKKVGKPIKASSLPGKPILDKLEECFIDNKLKREDRKGRICLIIDDLLDKGTTKNDFIADLKSYDIHVKLHENSAGLIYGMTFLDNIGLCVFKGSDLGKRYSAKNILEKLVLDGEHPNSKLNLDLTNQALKQASFVNGIKSVLAEWALKGVVVSASNSTSGESLYRMGHIGTSPLHHWPLDQKMRKYLLANGWSVKRASLFNESVNKIYQQSDSSPPPASHFTTSKNPVFLGTPEQVYQLLDLLFAVPDGENDFVSQELLREAKKKKRKRRP